MINTPTVIILGAGASKPYGFPIGKSFLSQILYDFDTGNQGYNKFKEFDIDLFKLKRFRATLSKTGKTSVDEFLEHRRDFIDIGKLAMAYTLLPFESTNPLFDFHEDSWYRYLYRKLNAPFEDFDQNKISIITFNYDRSLEHFLHTALKNDYNKTDEECAEKLNDFNIIHVHGKLGLLPWQNKNGVPYDLGRDFTHDNLDKAAQKIKIICEEIDQYPEFQQAHQELKEATYIYLIGFGYNETNLNRLGFENIIPNSKHDIRGTAYNLSNQEMRDIENYFDGKIKLFDADAYEFISNVPLK